jgi:hypothetical protein
VSQTSGSDAEDSMRESMGYNYSIYLMAGAPYLLLAGFGGLVYCSLRRKAALEQQTSLNASPSLPTDLPPDHGKPFGPLPAGEGGSSCPPSIVEDS